MVALSFVYWPINWSWLVTAAVYFDLADHALLLLGRQRVCSAAFARRGFPLPLLCFLGEMFLFIQRRQLEGPSMHFLEAWTHYIDVSSTCQLYEQLDAYTAFLPGRHCFIIIRSLSASSQMTFVWWLGLEHCNLSKMQQGRTDLSS